MPRIRGQGEEVVISMVPAAASGLRGAVGGPVGLAVDPSNAITIYEEDPTCSQSDAIAAIGTVGELEGTGIQVSVEPDSETTFYATQSDASGTSLCSPGVTYRQVTTPPEPPVFASTTPASPADDNLPRLVGTADPEATVAIYANSTCSGPPLASGSGTAFGAAGIQVSVPDNSTTSFHATATLAGISSACSSSSISYQEVTPPKEDPPKEEPPPGEGPGGGGKAPEAPGGKADGGSPVPNPPGKPPAPKLRTVPAGTANDNTPLVVGTAQGAARVEVFGSAECKGPVLVSGSVSELSAGLRVQVVDDQTVTFYGVSIDGGGDRSACSPEPAVYVEDSTLPQTRITMGPGVKTRKRTAVFRFLDVAGEAPGTAYFCKLDGRKWRACHAPFRVKRLSRRPHLFQVKAVDPAGNREEKPARRRFAVVR
jgi:hypothetical protein